MPSDPLILRPDPNCRCCYGDGVIYERHDDHAPERLQCSCIMRNAPQDEESQARIDAGDYEIVLPEESDSDDSDYHWDDLRDPDAGYDPQERNQWDNREEP